MSITRFHRAAKLHRCCHCAVAIEPGEMYEVTVHLPGVFRVAEDEWERFDFFVELSHIGRGADCPGKPVCEVCGTPSDDSPCRACCSAQIEEDEDCAREWENTHCIWA